MNEKLEYLIINERFLILEISSGIYRFLDNSSQLKLGESLDLFLPESIGIEAVLQEIFSEEKLSFELQDICRFNKSKSLAPVYFNLYFSLVSNNRLIIIFEDVSDRNIQYQKKIQAANECRLLSNKIALDRKYIQQAIKSTKEILLITDRFGKIENFSLATLQLFGYSKEELMNRSIAILFDNKKILFSDLILREDLALFCQTKIKEKIALIFSISSICAETNNYPNFIFVGRKIDDANMSIQSNLN